MRRLILICLGFAVAPVLPALTVDPVFGDGMVVQRDRPVTVFGDAAPGETVSVALAGDVVTVRAADDGRWLARLPARAASLAAFEIRIQGADTKVVLHDVLAGDVWLCAGQSNMEFPVAREAHAKTELPRAGDRSLRLLNHAFAGQYVYGRALPPATLARMNPASFYVGAWAKDGPPAAAPMSAVAYYFARSIRAEAPEVPIGLINYAVGGAPIESFMAPELLRARFPQKMRDDWLGNPALDTWTRGRARAHLGLSASAVAPDANHPYRPGFLWRAGVGRITDFPVAGFLWYQGESNATRTALAEEYPALFAAMVADWRARFQSPAAPFYYVQLSSCATPPRDRENWPFFRDGQRRTLASLPPPAGMAVCSDLGDAADVHPRDKKTVGERLARWALRDVYRKTGTVVSGPLVAGATASGRAVTVRFEHAAGLRSADGAAVSPLEIAGADGVFYPAEARIEGDRLVAESPSVAAPVAVRYAWRPYCRGNLVNAAGLPASTFEIHVR